MALRVPEKDPEEVNVTVGSRVTEHEAVGGSPRVREGVGLGVRVLGARGAHGGRPRP